MQATQPATKEVRRIAAEQMVLELTSKKESTAKGYLAVETMQTHFLNGVLRGGGAMAKPMDNAASLVAMLLWMSRTGRGSQLSCQGYMTATGRDDLFVMVEVKKAVKKIKDINPGVPQPVTSGTRKLARAALDLIPTIASTKFIPHREVFLLAAECVTGARIGELVGAQVGHGVFAHHYCTR